MLSICYYLVGTNMEVDLHPPVSIFLFIIQVSLSKPLNEEK